VKEFDGVLMVLVPAGCFTIGSTGGDDDERNGNKICFDTPYWIDQTEVTQQVFSSKRGTAEQSSAFRGDNNPVERITWFEAQDFCAKRIVRLPTEAEWEYAARGPDGLTYPWGDTFEENRAIYADNADQKTAPVGTFPDGASWVGALDMAGNVFEWTSGLYRPYPYREVLSLNGDSDAATLRVVRGGSWLDRFSGGLRASNRLRMLPNLSSNDLGFRCVRPYRPADLR
jgi:formylglycine-generating enzyme required for sulfatase activity